MLNLANAITVARILLIPVFIVLLFSELPHGAVLAAAVFTIAALTDKLDGYVARSRGSVTALGQFLDPLADKLLISAALIALLELQRLQSWVVMIIIAREFAVTALRLVGVAQGVSIPADRLGKAKTVSQIAAVLFLIFPHERLPHYYLAESVLIYVAVALTVVSGLQYFISARDRLRTPGAAPR